MMFTAGDVVPENVQNIRWNSPPPPAAGKHQDRIKLLKYLSFQLYRQYSVDQKNKPDMINIINLSAWNKRGERDISRAQKTLVWRNKFIAIAITQQKHGGDRRVFAQTGARVERIPMWTLLRQQTKTILIIRIKWTTVTVNDGFILIFRFYFHSRLDKFVSVPASSSACNLKTDILHNCFFFVFI